jgi:hypothetical protein
MLFRDVIDAYSENRVQKIDHPIQCQINPVIARLISLRCRLLLHSHLVLIPPGSPLPFTFSNVSSIRFSDFILMYNQQNATLHNSFIAAKCSTCFRQFLLPSSGAQTVHIASGIC